MNKQRSSCRICDVQSLFITGVHRLSNVNDPYVHSVNEALVNQKVSSRMVIGDRRWDTNLIQDLFSDRDVDLILSIQLVMKLGIIGIG